MRLRSALLCCLFVVCFNAVLPLQAADPPKSRFEAEIAQFERQDQKAAPPSEAILFLGSSSIRMWKLADSFPDRKVINRGFGGSEISDSLDVFDRIVLPYRPRVIVFYAGDNDLAAGKTPERVAADFQTLAERVQSVLPETKLVYVNIKPSPARRKLMPQAKDANQRIAQFAETQKDRVAIADIFTPMLDDKSEPRAELFVEDGLHLSPAGYKLWTGVVEPLLGRIAE